MVLRLLKIFLIILFFSWITVGPYAGAQESASKNEQTPEQSQNLIAVEVETFQSSALKKFLQEYRLILQQSKLDTSDVLQKFRKDFAGLKQENSQTIKFTRQQKLPKVVLKRITPKKNQALSSAGEATQKLNFDLAFTSKDFLYMQKFDSVIDEMLKDVRLSLEERQCLAEIEKNRHQKILLDKNSELGRLKTEIEQGPLNGHQAKLVQFSDRIKDLLEQIKAGRGDPKTLFVGLGNAYLESQRYLNSLDQEERFKLTRYAPQAGTALGSYELALWTFKMALTRNPNDGATNLLLGKVYSEMGNQDQALERARNAEYLFAKNREPDKAAQARSFIESLSNTS